MSAKSLEDLLESVDDPVTMLRENGAQYTSNFPVVPNEQTNWIDEQRAIIDSSILADLSHHMEPIHFEGPDTLEFFSDLCVNDFRNFEVGQAKQIVLCNHEGHIMGDGPLLRLGKEEFWGVPTCSNWVVYNVETGEYDVDIEVDPITPKQPGNPDTFIFQVQGPNSLEMLDEVTDADLASIGFYEFEEIELAGRNVRAFGHGMNTEEGFEFQGPYEYAEEIREAILEAGKPHGIRHLGSKSYLTQSVRLGWMLPGPPPIYDIDEMRGFREWLDARSWEANYSIEGSFRSDDIRDYYMTPVELGYENLIDFDHDFIGKEALQAEVEHPERTLVHLLWHDADVIEVFASIFSDGDIFKFIDLPRPGWAQAAFDEVRKDGALIGTSQPRAFQPDVQSIVSLCRIDREYSDPGTEVLITWGEGTGSPNPNIEEHVQSQIRATVAEIPYSKDRRK